MKNALRISRMPKICLFICLFRLKIFFSLSLYLSLSLSIPLALFLSLPNSLFGFMKNVIIVFSCHSGFIVCICTQECSSARHRLKQEWNQVSGLITTSSKCLCARVCVCVCSRVCVCVCV